MTDGAGVRRLSELLGWADYIAEALILSDDFEPVEPEELRRLRESAWRLREEISRVRVQAEFRNAALLPSTGAR